MVSISYQMLYIRVETCTRMYGKNITYVVQGASDWVAEGVLLSGCSQRRQRDRLCSSWLRLVARVQGVCRCVSGQRLAACGTCGLSALLRWI